MAARPPLDVFRWWFISGLAQSGSSSDDSTLFTLIGKSIFVMIVESNLLMTTWEKPLTLFISILPLIQHWQTHSLKPQSAGQPALYSLAKLTCHVGEENIYKYKVYFWWNNIGLNWFLEHKDKLTINMNEYVMLILNLTYILIWDVFKYLIDIVTLFNGNDYIHNKSLLYLY